MPYAPMSAAGDAGQSPPASPYMRAREFAALLGVHPSTLRRMLKDGRCTVQPHWGGNGSGRNLVFPREAALAFVREAASGKQAS